MNSCVPTPDCPAEALANYVQGATFEDLPNEVVAWARVLIEDHLGCALGALELPEACAIRAVARQERKADAALAIGEGHSSLATAVFCNAQLSNLLDFDDAYDWSPPWHPGCLIIPAALAVAEDTNANGAEFLTAVILAYEVAMRVGRGILENALVRGVASTLAVDALAAGLAAGKLYGLSARELRSLMSIIAVDEGGLSLRPAPVSYRIGTIKGNFGSHAQMGVGAAVKARAGLSGISGGMLERNLAEWQKSGLPATGYAHLTAGLGREYFCTRLSLKPAPSCRVTHIPMTAAWQALSGRSLDARHVSRIRIFGVPRLESAQCSTMIEAQFSVPCAVALALSGIKPGPAWYSSGTFQSESIRALAGKVEQVMDPEARRAEIIEARATCHIEIELKQGRRLTGECKNVKGSPSNPLTEAERLAKFAANTARFGERSPEVQAAITRLDEASSLAELTAALAACADG